MNSISSNLEYYGFKKICRCYNVAKGLLNIIAPQVDTTIHFQGTDFFPFFVHLAPVCSECSSRLGLAAMDQSD
ncbi:hypothetical protein ABEB36_010583 [Hypothenemus hampei]|uniref:Uncharacterized protein n=1 Tax=Hypothenemus hampei TaxID=57062 RepID=A0ABD1ECH4_HYPHA